MWFTETAMAETAPENPITPEKPTPEISKPENPMEREKTEIPRTPQEVRGLVDELQGERAARQAAEQELKTRGWPEIRGGAGDIEKLLGDILEEQRKTREAQELLTRAQISSLEQLLIPEYERPKDKLGWIKLFREQITDLRELGESPYTPYLWSEKPEIRRILNSLPKTPEFRGLGKDLVIEAWALQQEDKLTTQWKQRSSKTESLGELLDIAPATGVMLTPDLLMALSDLPEAETPGWLKGIIPEEEKTLSMQISRGAYLYMKFFGEWTEYMARKLDEASSIEEQARAKWLNGEFGKDKKKWLGWVDKQLVRLDWSREPEMQALNREVLARLGFGNEGLIPNKLLKQMFAKKPEDMLADREFERVKKEVPDDGGMSLFDLLKIGETKEEDGTKRQIVLNMFCQNVDKDQVEYTRWLVSALAGSKYAEESALRFMRYTGESGEMNTTAAPVPYSSDSFYQLAWTERRRMSEARKRRAGGPRVTLGRYKTLCQSWLREADMEVGGQKKKVKVIEHLREGKWFHTLPWGQLGPQTYIGDFLLNLLHTSNAFKTITDKNIELIGKEGLLSEGDRLEKINKSFQYAFPEWEDEKEGKTGFDRRERWAQQALALAHSGRLDELNKQEWSPWVTFIFGLIYEHHPDRKLPPPELQSPSGIKMEKQIPHSNRWHKDPQKAEHGQLFNPNSVADLLGQCAESDFLTPAEIELVKAICQL